MEQISDIKQNENFLATEMIKYVTRLCKTKFVTINHGNPKQRGIFYNFKSLETGQCHFYFIHFRKISKVDYIQEK